LVLLSSPGRGRSGAARRPQVAKRFGGALDILVNNVGRNIRKATTEYSAEEYRAVMATNLDSTYRMCQACPMSNPTLTLP
jgi:NAD(P)-dependent dehydrogenase (short-subunit alcohol dehydrogenase family)